MKIAPILILCFLTYSCSNSRNQNYLIEQEKGEEANIIEFDQKFENKKALQLNSDAIEQVRNRNFQKAKTLFLNALEIEPENPVILNNLGLVEREIGDFNKAVDYFRQSFSSSQYKYNQSAANLALTYYQLEEYQKAIETSKFVLERNPNKVTIISSYLTLSLSYADSGECSKAKIELMNLKQAIEKNDLNEQVKNLENKIKNCVQSSSRLRP